jgi:parvulin-like peptidyl-prolyl isomerase
MSILERLRGSTDSTPMQVVLILIVLAFLGWTQLPTGQAVQVAVSVNGERVLQQEYQQRYAIEQRYMPGKLDAEAEAELAAQVKRTLARETVVAQEAERLGFDVSPEEVSRWIKTDLRYHRNGKFSYETFEDEIKASGRGRADFETDYRDALLRSRLKVAVLAGVSLPLADLKKAYEEQFSTSNLEFVRLSASDAGALAPTSEELTSFLADQFARVQAQYDADKVAKYDLPDRATLRMISLATTEADRADIRARLETVQKELAAGADFGAAARRWSEDSTAPAGGDLGERRVGSLTTAVREALQALEPGQVTPVLDEGDRVAVYQLVSRAPARVVPIEEVQLPIAEMLLREDKLKAWADAVAAGWTDAPPPELLAQVGAIVQPLGGINLGSYPGGLGMPPSDLVAKAKGAAPGTVLGVGFEGSASRTWYVVRLIDHAPADPQYFARWKSAELMDAREAAWEAYVDDLMARASVDMQGGEAVTGGWQDWLDAILPK